MRARGRRVGEPPAWWTGTIEDEFTPVYMGMAQTTVLHRGFSPPEVDAMELVTIWALQGVAQQERLLAAAAASYRAPIGEPSMVPLTDEEKAARYAARQSRRAPRRGPTLAG